RNGITWPSRPAATRLSRPAALELAPCASVTHSIWSHWPSRAVADERLGRFRARRGPFYYRYAGGAAERLGPAMLQHGWLLPRPLRSRRRLHSAGSGARATYRSVSATICYRLYRTNAYVLVLPGVFSYCDCSSASVSALDRRL